MFVSRHTSLLSLQTTAVKSPLVLARMSQRFSLSVLGSRSLGMPFLFSLTVPQEIFFWAKSSKRSGEEKKLSTYSLWPNRSTPLVRFVTVAWVAVRCCAALCLYRGKHSCHVYPVESHCLNIFMPKRLRFFWMYCLNNNPSLEFHNDFIYFQMFGRVVKF